MRHSGRSLGAALLVLAAVLPAGPTLAGTPPTVTVSGPIGTCGLSGDVDLGTSDQLTIKHRRADGTLVGTETVTPQAGSWLINCPGPVNKGDDRLEFYRGSETTPFRVFRFPRLALRPDRVDDVVRGNVTRSPDHVELIVTNCTPDGSDCANVLQTEPVLAPVTGAFNVAVGDMRGGDGVFLSWSKGLDTMWTGGFVGQVMVQPGAPEIRVTGPRPGQKVSVTLRRGSWTASTTVTIPAIGVVQARVRHKGKLVKPKVGDVITSDVEADAKVVVPPWFLYWDDTGIHGRCFKNAVYSVEVLDANGLTYKDLDAAGEDGSWFDPRVPTSDEQVLAWCAKPSGDQLFMVGIKS